MIIAGPEDHRPPSIAREPNISNTNAKRDAVRKLNDEFRRSGAGGRIVATPDINALPPPEKLDILRAVQSFEAFTPEDDPHGEHDFGILDHNGARVYFKIDYYDNELHGGSEDPADPVQTTRVLTIMFAHEY